jgi:hypothetical protein
VPVLSITDGSGNINLIRVVFNLPAVMLFPEDESARRHYIAAATLDFLKHHRAPEQNLDFPITPPEVLEIISEGPKPDELISRVAERVEQGRIAGNILDLVLSLSQFAPTHATVRKAIRVIGVHLVKEGKRIRRRPPASSSTLKSIWTRFKPVSHLWAAVPSDFVEYVSGTSDFSKSVNFGGVRELIDRGLEFLAVAEKIRLFGENHHAPGGRNNSSAIKIPMLDPETTWKAPRDLTVSAGEKIPH